MEMELTKIRKEEILSETPGAFKPLIPAGATESSQMHIDTSFIEVNNENISVNFAEDTQVLHIPEVYNDVGNTGLDEPSKVVQKSPFIEANTEATTLFQLENECTTAVFSKDNELTIAHHDFIMAMHECASKVFGNEIISEPDIRVSHVIKGRIPEALRKPVQELLPHEKTMYWERLAFVIEIPTITRVIGGNTLTLCVGGVRALNHQNLYSKKSVERFKVFTGFRNKICTNTCVSTDGILNDVKVLSINELKNHIMQLLSTYNMENHFTQMQNLENRYLTESQFCQILGRGRLYQHLPKNLKLGIPELLFNDGQLNATAKAYFDDENFSKNKNGDINCWKMYNLLTGANKSSYIDNYLDRGVNAFSFSEGISNALSGSSTNYSWFLG